MKRIFILSLLLQFIFSAGIYASAEMLFVIERSKNANVVRYDANITNDGKIDSKKPVDGYWLLYAKKNGEREELSAFDKKAYGYKAVFNKDNNNYDFSLKAVNDKPMTLAVYGNKPKIKIKINNKDCFLQKVYIESKDGALGIPKVSFYALYGTDVETGENVEEKIVLKK